MPTVPKTRLRLRCDADADAAIGMSNSDSDSMSKADAETQRESRVSAGRESRADGRRLQTSNTEGRVHVAECVTRFVWQSMAVFEGLCGVGICPEAAVACERSRAHPRHGPGSPGSPDRDAQSQQGSSSASDSFSLHSACPASATLQKYGSYSC